MTEKEFVNDAVKAIARTTLKKPESATDGDILCLCKYILGLPVLKNTLQETHH